MRFCVLSLRASGKFEGKALHERNNRSFSAVKCLGLDNSVLGLLDRMFARCSSN